MNPKLDVSGSASLSEKRDRSGSWSTADRDRYRITPADVCGKEEGGEEGDENDVGPLALGKEEVLRFVSFELEWIIGSFEAIPHSSSRLQAPLLAGYSFGASFELIVMEEKWRVWISRAEFGV